MFPPTRYLEWAIGRYGRVAFDLASSGTPVVPWSEIDPALPAGIDDLQSFERAVQAIAAYNDCATEEVVSAIGASQAIFLAYAAILSPGDEVLVERPAYEPLLRAAEGLGAMVRRFERRPERGFAVDPSEVAALVRPRTRAIVLSNLHNPSGARVSDETFVELAAIAEARGAYLVVDEVYAPFDDLPEDGVFRKSARKLADNVVAVSSLTKAYGLGMHRIGWLLGPPEVVSGARSASIATVGHPALSHAAFGVAAFESLGALARRAKDALAGKRAIAERWISGIAGAGWSAPREGLFGLVTLPGRGDLLPEIERLADESGVLVAPGTFFDMPDSFRLSWASCDRARFEEGLKRLSPLVAPR